MEDRAEDEGVGGASPQPIEDDSDRTKNLRVSIFQISQKNEDQVELLPLEIFECFRPVLFLYNTLCLLLEVLATFCWLIY